MLSRFNPFQIKVFIALLLLLVFLIGSGYYYLNAMKTLNGGLNINKAEDIDKIYGYSVYSDFYFRITKYNDKGEKEGEYSKLIPIKTKVGLNFISDNTEAVINSSIDDGSILELSGDGEVGGVLEELKKMAPVYGDIVSTQDDVYFTKSVERISTTHERLYGEKLNVSPDLINNYYVSEKQTAIPNLNIRYFKLKKRYEFKIIKNNNWQPNIAEWLFDDDNRIYFQYLGELKYKTLDDYIDKDSGKKDVITIKTITINNDIVKPIYIEIKESENKIQTIFSDNHGYLYTLILQARNKKSLETYSGDYFKIALGIFFTSENGFNTNFIEQQKKVEDYFKNIKASLREIEDFDEDFEDSEKLYNHFNLKEHPTVKELNASKFDKKMEIIKKYYGSYPSESVIAMINKELNAKKLIKDALENIERPQEGGWFGGNILPFDKSMEIDYLITVCKTKTLDCLQHLKDNDWDVKK